MKIDLFFKQEISLLIIKFVYEFFDCFNDIIILNYTYLTYVKAKILNDNN